MNRSIIYPLSTLRQQLSGCITLQKKILSHCLLSLTLLGFSGIAHTEANFKDGFITQHIQSKDIQLELTEAELDWLAAHPTIRVGVRHNWKPVEFMSEGRQFIGITLDYLAKLEPFWLIKHQ
jgi:hypothetical protein